jgi:hypothetical protein
VRRDLVILVVLLLCAVKYTWDVPRQVMIVGYDETVYLTRGLDLLETGVPAQDNSPLYAPWYFALGLLQTDPAGLYYLNIRVLAILTVLLGFIAARLMGAGRFPAAAAAVFLLISFGNVRSLPKVAHFAALCALVLMILLLLVPKRWKLPLAGIGLVGLSFARPEFMYAAMLFFLGAVIVLMRRRQWSRLAVFALPLLLFAVVFGYYGRIPALSGSSRAIWAFGQHYAAHTPVPGENMLDRWNHWDEVVRRDFAGATSIPGAFAANPSAFTGHVLRNAGRLPGQFFEFIAKHSPLFFPNTRFFITLEAALLLVLLLAVLLRSPRRLGQRLMQLPREHTVESAMIASVLSVVLLVALVVFPREHYLWMAVPPAGVLLAAIVPSRPVNEKTGRVLLLSLLAVVPVFSNLDYDAGQDPFKVLLRLSRDPECPPGVILGDPSGAEVYFRGTNLTYTGVWYWTDFSAVLREQRPLIIWSNEILESIINKRDSVSEGYSFFSKAEMIIRNDVIAQSAIVRHLGSVNDGMERWKDGKMER